MDPRLRFFFGGTRDMHKGTPQGCKVRLKATISSSTPKNLQSMVKNAKNVPYKLNISAKGGGEEKQSPNKSFMA